MSDEPSADLSMIVRQQKQMLTEMGTIRDDISVMMAISQRLDGTVTGLVNEIAQQSRMDRRVRELEGLRQ